MDYKNINRRRLTAAIASIGVASLAGCSNNTDSGGTQEPTEEPTPTPDPTHSGDMTDTTKTTGTQTDEPESPSDRDTPVPTARETPQDRVSDGVIESLADYEYVARNADDWIGRNVEFPSIEYFDSWDGDYLAFRKRYEQGGRPTFVKENQSGIQLSDGVEYQVEAIVEKVEEFQDETPVLYLQDAQISEI